jgi:hypothetical protein
MLRLTIREDGTVWQDCHIDTTNGGFTHKCVCFGNDITDAYENLFDGVLAEIPIDIVDPKVLSIRRLYPEHGLGWTWEVECYINGESSWMMERKDLKPDTIKFVEWVQKHGHTVTDMRKEDSS